MGLCFIFGTYESKSGEMYNKNAMKRILALILALTVIGTVLPGCGGESKDESGVQGGATLKPDANKAAGNDNPAGGTSATPQ
jgi:hypothetical protein